MAVITVIGLLWIFDAQPPVSTGADMCRLGELLCLAGGSAFCDHGGVSCGLGRCGTLIHGCGKMVQRRSRRVGDQFSWPDVRYSPPCAAPARSRPATIGRVAIPEMTKRGYKSHFAAGSVACAGTLGIMIPPSLSLILYGVLTGTSIGKLFMAGIIPGLVLGLMMCLYVMAIAWLKPSMAPPMTGVVAWSDRFRALLEIGRVVAVNRSRTGKHIPGAGNAYGVGCRWSRRGVYSLSLVGEFQLEGDDGVFGSGSEYFEHNNDSAHRRNCHGLPHVPPPAFHKPWLSSSSRSDSDLGRP